MCLSREVGHKFARVRKSRVLEALGKEEDALSEVCAHLLLERDRVQAKVCCDRVCVCLQDTDFPTVVFCFLCMFAFVCVCVSCVEVIKFARCAQVYTTFSRASHM